jgi:hypothetical protein
MEKELLTYKAEIEKRYQASQMKTYIFPKALPKVVEAERSSLQHNTSSLQRNTNHSPHSSVHTQHDSVVRHETSDQKVARIIKKAQHIPTRSHLDYRSMKIVPPLNTKETEIEKHGRIAVHA